MELWFWFVPSSFGNVHLWVIGLEESSFDVEEALLTFYKKIGRHIRLGERTKAVDNILHLRLIFSNELSQAELVSGSF